MNLKLQGIHKRYGKTCILDAVNLELNTGEIVGLLGRNGSGKSTLLKILFGTLKATSGNISIDKQPYPSYTKFAKKQIAYLPQQSMLPKNIRVRDVIPMFLESGAAQDKIFYAEGVANFANEYVYNLSLGERKYLGVLLACSLPHPIVLLDEPFSMADPLTIDRIKKLLNHTKKDKIVLITDHYYHDVMEISSRVMLLKDGNLREVSSTEMLRSQEYTR